MWNFNRMEDDEIENALIQSSGPSVLASSNLCLSFISKFRGNFIDMEPTIHDDFYKKLSDASTFAAMKSNELHSSIEFGSITDTEIIDSYTINPHKEPCGNQIKSPRNNLLTSIGQASKTKFQCRSSNNDFTNINSINSNLIVNGNKRQHNHPFSSKTLSSQVELPYYRSMSDLDISGSRIALSPSSVLSDEQIVGIQSSIHKNSHGDAAADVSSSQHNLDYVECSSNTSLSSSGHDSSRHGLVKRDVSPIGKKSNKQTNQQPVMHTESRLNATSSLPPSLQTVLLQLTQKATNTSANYKKIE